MKAKPGQIGMLRLRTTGRRTGRDRRAILGYLADGRDFILVAMNGWGAAEPAWWLNLQSRPEAVVELPRESIPVVGREALGEERSRLWKQMGFLGRDMEPYAALRPRPTAIVVLESRTSTGPERARD